MLRPVAAFLILAPAGCATAQNPGATTAPIAAPVHADTAALRRALDSIADAHHGVVGYSVIDMETGARLSRRGDETIPVAVNVKSIPSRNSTPFVIAASWTRGWRGGTSACGGRCVAT